MGTFRFRDTSTLELDPTDANIVQTEECELFIGTYGAFAPIDAKDL